MLEPDKQQFLIHHLAQSAADFEKAIAGVPPEQWSISPAPNQWSVGEIAEHVLIIDGNVARFIAKMRELPEEPYDNNHCARKDQLVMRVADDRTIKIEAPPTVRPTGRLVSAAEFYMGFREAQSRLTLAVSENQDVLRGRFREHPVLRKLDGYQWLLVCSCHRIRHMHQIEEVKRTFAT
jgi:hypothetical protein